MTEGFAIHGDELILHRTEEDIWDSPLFLCLFLGGIGTEWVLRKKWSLL